MKTPVRTGSVAATAGSAPFVAVIAGIAVAIAASAHAQPNVFWPNDDCQYPTPIAGQGSFLFDTRPPHVTPGPPALPTCSDCPGSFIGIENDVWFVWTSTCSGSVEMKTVTDPSAPCLDTVLAVYDVIDLDFPPCPGLGALIACCDDISASPCNVASVVAFAAVCNQRYWVRVGLKLGAAAGAGTLKIECLEQKCLVGQRYKNGDEYTGDRALGLAEAKSLWLPA